MIRQRKQLFPLIGIFSLGITILFFSLHFTLLADDIQEPLDMRDFMDQDAEHTHCRECHFDDPNTIESHRDVNIIDGITLSCIRGEDGFGGITCHSDEERGRSHSRDIRPYVKKPDMEVPEDLHLYYDQLTCITCHAPHGELTSAIQMVSRDTIDPETGKYKSYLLRRTNIGSALCFACHQDK